MLFKKKIAEKKAKESVFITQNFTQLEFDGEFVQDLIICYYDYDSNAKEKYFFMENGIWH